MSSESEIILRIDKIRQVFQAAQLFAELEPDLNTITEYCNGEEGEFLSIAFEAAAMALATRDLGKGNALTQWAAFAGGPARPHTAQAHAGLGWALAQQKVTTLTFPEVTDELLFFRVLDGYGYYDGIFRQRHTIGSQVVPEHINEQWLKGYDQGVGRSLWYISKGSIEKLLSLLSPFPPYRHQDLWRGIGIASAYVGGCDEDILQELSISAGIYRTQLSIGSILAASARHSAAVPTPDSNLACLTWCHCSAQEAAQIPQKLFLTNALTAQISYPEWLLELEAQLPANQHADNL